MYFFISTYLEFKSIIRQSKNNCLNKSTKLDLIHKKPTKFSFSPAYYRYVSVIWNLFVFF